MKCVPVDHGIPAVLNRDVPWLHRHSENGALVSNKIIRCEVAVRSQALWDQGLKQIILILNLFSTNDICFG